MGKTSIYGRRASNFGGILMICTIESYCGNSDCIECLPFQKKEEELKRIEHTLRNAEYMMRDLYPNFNSHRNAERFIHSCLKANEALRQIQRGNMETVHRYWREHE
jgi:hypothetical protein